MKPSARIPDDLSNLGPLTVGAVAGREALAVTPVGCDVVELRLDSLGSGPEMHNFARNSPLPLLITARGSAEGGQSDWSLEERAAAYRSLLPFATFIDIELRDFNALEEVIKEAREAGVIIVGSFHDFEKTPSIESLLERIDSLADLHKFALMVRSPDDVAGQLELASKLSGTPFAVMGMGPLGAAARPLMAKAGSLLNYGYLGSTPTAPNQWPAELLKRAIAI